MKKKKGIIYADSGVNISAGNKAVEMIKTKVHNTFDYFPGKVLTKLGLFCSLAEMEDGRIIGTSTDGVGTKLKIAILLGKHNTVGIDLVAMCVNDLLPHNVMPAGFLNYMAMAKQVPERTDEIISGVVNGCIEAATPLLGGEMAEMPGMYQENDYDLAGFAFGFARSKKDLIFGNKIEPGMIVYGLLSSGLHSNGYSLVRKVFDIGERNKKSTLKILNAKFSRYGETLGEELLRPTRIYARRVKKLVKKYRIAGMAHVTGGGLPENISRILPKDCDIKLNMSWPIHDIFYEIMTKGNVSKEEMRRTFNIGIGFVVISPDDVNNEDNAYQIGEVVAGQGKIIFP